MDNKVPFQWTHYGWSNYETWLVATQVFNCSTECKSWRTVATRRLENLSAYWAMEGRGGAVAKNEATIAVAAELMDDYLGKPSLCTSCAYSVVDCNLDVVNWVELAWRLIDISRPPRLPLAIRVCGWLPAWARKVLWAAWVKRKGWTSSLHPCTWRCEERKPRIKAVH